MDVLWLGDPQSREPRLVGGKIATLARLADSYPVPPAFCLRADVVETPSFLDTGAERLSRLVGESYRALCLKCDTRDLPVAVRSSALDEDGDRLSFAGQYSSYLNVVGTRQVCGAVLACLRSARSPRAEAYRQRWGTAPSSAPMAVLVQKLVLAQASAVAFSANPVTGARDEIWINATFGLGETIVGGLVIPDTFVVRKHDLQVLRRELGDKEMKAVPVAGGVAREEVEEGLRAVPSLTDSQVLEVASLVVSLERRLGLPVDVECSFERDQLSLLQCRPITTIS